MPFLLFLLSVATLVAVASKSKASGGPSQTFTLDANMPEPLRHQVIAALIHGTDPAALEAFATAIGAQYPLSAQLLHAKAASLRSGPLPAAGVPSLSATSTDPGGPPLDPSMPPSLVTFVHTELVNETDPAKLFALAQTLAAQYPVAAALLQQRAAVLNVQPSGGNAPVITPSPSPLPTTPASATGPTNPPAPALPIPGLDPGMPSDVAQAVMTELASDNDPNKLQAYAQQIQGQYPMAAQLLATKASTLLALMQPAVVPASVQPSVSPAPSGSQMGLDANMPPQTVALVLSELANEGDPTKLQSLAAQLAPQYPIAAGLLNTRANVILATRTPSAILPNAWPSPAPAAATTYTVQQGDFPWKIAAHFTGQGSRWTELVAANPQKQRAADGNFATLLPGEKLTLPASWPTTRGGAAPAASAAIAPASHLLTTVAPAANAAPATMPIIAPAPTPTTAPAAASALDPGIPPDVATAVLNALNTASDPAQLRGFASAVAQKGYSIAAGLLNAKASALSAAPSGSAGPAPAAPPGATYKVKAGDSPSKIAAAIVHDGNRWPELVAANPQKKKAASGNFASLLPGEVLQLPASWVSTPSSAAAAPTGA